MVYIVREDELYHHGILGQKWGKQNGPPYPLSASKHSSSEKKAGWMQSLKERKKVRLGQASAKAKDARKLVRQKKREARAAERIKKQEKKQEAALQKSLDERQKVLDKRLDADAKNSKGAKETAHMMTDDELKAAIDRMTLEKRYTQLVAETATKEKGDKYVKTLLINSAKRGAEAVAPKVAEYLMKQGVKTIIRKNVEKRDINPKLLDNFDEDPIGAVAKFERDEIDRIYKEMFPKKKNN